MKYIKIYEKFKDDNTYINVDEKCIGNFLYKSDINRYNKVLLFVVDISYDHDGKLVKAIHIKKSDDRFVIISTFLMSQSQPYKMIDGAEYMMEYPQLYTQLVEYDELYTNDLLKKDKYKSVREKIELIKDSEELGLL